jgi:hypothetical protein
METQEKPKIKRTMKVKKSLVAAITHAEPEPPTPTPVPDAPVAPAEPVIAPAPEKVKRTMKIKKGPRLPSPVPEHLRTSLAVETMELVREWYEARDEPVPEAEVKACLEMLEQEKREQEQILRDWENPPPPRPPTPEEELGPMPAYGTPEFWRWCMKRKAIRLAKEAAIIAAGGTVPEKKAARRAAPGTAVPAAKKPKEPKAAKPTAK